MKILEGIGKVIDWVLGGIFMMIYMVVGTVFMIAFYGVILGLIISVALAIVRTI